MVWDLLKTLEIESEFGRRDWVFGRGEFGVFSGGGRAICGARRNQALQKSACAPSSVVLTLDGDQTGSAATKQIAAELRPACRVSQVPLPGDMQPDRMPADQIRDVLRSQYERRQKIGATRPNDNQSSSRPTGSGNRPGSFSILDKTTQFLRSSAGLQRHSGRICAWRSKNRTAVSRRNPRQKLRTDTSPAPTL